MTYHVSDFDLNGELELVMAIQTRNGDLQTDLHFFNPATHQQISTYPLPDSIKYVDDFHSGHTRSSTSQELVWVATGPRLVVFDPLISDFVHIGDPFQGKVVRDIALKDINGDGVEEIFIAFDDRDIQVFQYDGNTYGEIFNQNLGVAFTGIYDLFLGNFDQDADLEFACRVNHRIRVYDYPSLTLKWESDSTYPQFFQMVAGDIDQDGVHDIIANNSNSIFKFDGSNGQLINTYVHPFRNGFEVEGISLGNIDASAELEILVGYTTRPFILDHTITSILTQFDNPEVVMGDFISRDIDNDDKIDLFVLGQRGVYQYEERFTTSIDKSTPDVAALKIYPNPTQNTIHIEVSEWGSHPSLSIQILDSFGRKLLSKEVNEMEETVNLAALPAGNYVVLLFTGGNLLSAANIIKQ